MENLDHPVWTSPAWQRQVRDWIETVLTDRSERITGPLEQPRVRPWSTQLTVDSTAGRLWFKVNCPGSACEAGLVAALATVAPEQVVVPVAVDPERGWLLSPDAGPTLAANSGADEQAWTAVMAEWGQLQRRLVPYADTLAATGLPVLPPVRAIEWVSAYADRLTQRPADDPRRLTADDHAAVERRIEALRPVAAELAAGPVPLSLDHNDLHANNAFAPVPGTRLRFFDFGDALWAHPFTSLWLARRAMAEQLHTDGEDRRIVRAVDACLEVWNDLASGSELRSLARAAERFGPVHRTHAWARCLDTTDVALWRETVTGRRDWLLRSTAD